MTAWVTDDQGQEWGTAVQIAQHLGGGVQPSTVRRWHGIRGLRKVRDKDDQGRRQVLFLVKQAAEINADILAKGLGRGRRLDTRPSIVHTAGKHNSAQVLR